MSVFERLGDPVQPKSWDRWESTGHQPFPPILDWLLLAHFIAIVGGLAAALVIGARP